MTDNITLPRAEIERIRKSLAHLIGLIDPEVFYLDDDIEALAAIDAALAEPEPTVKESLTVDHIRSIWLDSWKACGNVPTPVLAEHFARQIERAHGIGLAKPTGKDSLQVDAARELIDAKTCRYPACQDADGRCPRIFAGQCSGPGGVVA